MKRICNDVAVQTLLYTVLQDTMIKVKDYKCHPAFLFGEEKNNPKNYDIVYEGKVEDFTSYKFPKAYASRIVDTEVISDSKDNECKVWLVLGICTKEDNY